MSYTTIEKLKYLDFIIQDYIYLSGQANVDLDKEIYNNFWQIMFSDEIVKDVTLFDLQNFLYKLFQKRKEQINELNIKSDVIFYLLVEEVTRQLCFNLISGNVRPTFGCTLNILASPDPILKKFLEDEKMYAQQGGNLLFKDMIFLEPGDEGYDEEEERDPKSYICDVYVTQIQ